MKVVGGPAVLDSLRAKRKHSKKGDHDSVWGKDTHKKFCASSWREEKGKGAEDRKELYFYDKKEKGFSPGNEGNGTGLSSLRKVVCGGRGGGTAKMPEN